jgi:hypothetical protein
MVDGVASSTLRGRVDNAKLVHPGAYRKSNQGARVSSWNTVPANNAEDGEDFQDPLPVEREAVPLK